MSTGKWRRIADPPVAWLALRVAIFVGTVLNVIHHFDLFLGTPLTGTTVVQMALTYVVPYCVSTHGQVFGKR